MQKTNSLIDVCINYSLVYLRCKHQRNHNIASLNFILTPAVHSTFEDRSSSHSPNNNNNKHTTSQMKFMLIGCRPMAQAKTSQWTLKSFETGNLTQITCNIGDGLCGVILITLREQTSLHSRINLIGHLESHVNETRWVIAGHTLIYLAPFEWNIFARNVYVIR